MHLNNSGSLFCRALQVPLVPEVLRVLVELTYVWLYILKYKLHLLDYDRVPSLLGLRPILKSHARISSQSFKVEDDDWSPFFFLLQGPQGPPGGVGPVGSVGEKVSHKTSSAQHNVGDPDSNRTPSCVTPAVYSTRIPQTFLSESVLWLNVYYTTFSSDCDIPDGCCVNI